MSRTSSNLPSLMHDHSEATAPSKPGDSRVAGVVKAGSEHFKLIFAIVALVAAAIIMSLTLFGGGPSLAEMTRYTACIDAETGEAFPKYEVPTGEFKPYTNPKTGKKTIWPAESCNWTKDGKAKIEPTYVLMNEFVGKEGPTICPDCGRRVVFRNPPPPTELMDEAAKVAKTGE